VSNCFRFIQSSRADAAWPSFQTFAASLDSVFHVAPLYSEDLWFENVVGLRSLPDFPLIYYLGSNFVSSGHNIDDTCEFLKHFQGLKRMDNYIKAYKIWQLRFGAPGISLILFLPECRVIRGNREIGKFAIRLSVSVGA
jgi:hypothetical protein